MGKTNRGNSEHRKQNHHDTYTFGIDDLDDQYQGSNRQRKGDRDDQRDVPRKSDY